MSEKLNIILNGKKVTGTKGETILELARRNNIDIPTLCNDPRLEPYSSCYVCVVEVEGMKGLQPSCSTRLTEGMKITTDSENIRKSRKTSLDLLLSDHYADCIGPCKETCPAGVDVQGYISLIDKGMYSDAVALIKETNPLPAICGRVCVRPCEVACRRNLLDEGAPVGIDYMKRFASDADLEAEESWKPQVKENTGKKVAIIGAGPGGLSAAFFLRKEGHDIDIFEAAPKAGGWLRYGIPEYRLPNDLLQKEVDNITDLGVNIFYNKKLGENITYKNIKEKYDTTILAIGSQKGTLIRTPGDDAENVLPGIDFLKEMEMTGEKYDFSGKTVVVVGGGNTAMDCCRTAMRCGAKKVYVVYRRSEKEMPANPIEIHESKLEGVEYLFLTNPKVVNKDEKGKVKSLTLLKMELGEPDSSGRRRPIPIEGSDYELKTDFILAAIGQNTTVDFLEDINEFTDKGELKLNRWGDIDADPKTLQTGIKSVFACGDGVTGPATLIEAIAQAKIASYSCHQFLTHQHIEPPKKEFLSKKDNFKPQEQEEYKNHFEMQKREEMPTLKPDARYNFKEVELGYSEEQAKHEAQRCLECGCVAYYDCDLKKFATEYGAEQTKYDGEFTEHKVDFRHPFVEIDNNKCILCGRCIRICNEVVGAKALGLVERGFNTFVAPSMGDKLQDTTCESCGMCISTCPTGAITENVDFKPGPLKLESIPTICNYCSVGCEININHHDGFVMNVSGKEGMVNQDGNICRFPKFGYSYINDNSRVKKPMLKENGSFKEISFKEAYRLIAEKIKSVSAEQNAFFAGARLSNEEMYLVQKIARAAAKTNNINSFHYIGRGRGYVYNSFANVPFEQIKEAGKIWIIGSEINKENAVAGFMIHNAHVRNNIDVNLVTTKENNFMEHKVSNTIKIKSYYYFIKAVNHYLLSNNKENMLFIKDNSEKFDEYKEALLKEDFNKLYEKSGVCCKEHFEAFAEEFNRENNAVIVFSEKEISSTTSFELFNLTLITGKFGKTASGLISLKEKNNSQGLVDMGITPNLGTGTQKITDHDLQHRLKEKWQVSSLPGNIIEDQVEMLEKGKVKNMFVFGEDPVGCAFNKDEVKKWLGKAGFLMVQDYFMTDTAKEADLVLPASFPFETGGSYTNTQKVIQRFEKEVEPKIEMTSPAQLLGILKEFGHNNLHSVEDIMMEVISILPSESIKLKHRFFTTEEDELSRRFDHGADHLVKRFQEMFEEKFKE